jgi:hypothetical protein
MTGGWFDPEAIDGERIDADIEQASLEEQGRDHSRLLRVMERLRAAGRLAEAAAACPHGWTGPLPAGHTQWAPGACLCQDCGSVIQGFGRTAVVLMPCAFQGGAR